MKEKPTFVAYLKEGGLNKYIKELELYVSTNKGDRNAMHDLLLIYAKTKCYVKYENLIQIALEKYKDISIFHRLHAKYLIFIKKDLKQAQSHLKTCLEINPLEPCWVRYYSGTVKNYYEKVYDKILYTPIPKNGSTSIKYFIAEKLKLSSSENPHEHFGNPYFNFNLYDSATLEESKKILILRDPLSRMKSYHKKNILEASSLNNEIGNFTLQKIYGLELQPSLSTFIQNLWQYVFCFDDVFHHILPQAAYIQNLNEYDFVCELKDIDEAVSFVSKTMDNSVDTVEIKAPKRMVGKASSNNELSSKLENYLSDIYENDYKLIECFNTSSELERLEYTQVSFAPNRANFTEKIENNSEINLLNNKTFSDIEFNKKFVKLEKKIETMGKNLVFLTRLINDIYDNLTMQISTTENIAFYVNECIRNSVPMSLIRIGDGEGLILGYGESSPEEDVDEILKIHFGYTLSLEDKNYLKKAIESAIISSDVIGIPTKKRSLLTNPESRIQKGILAAYSALNKYDFHDKRIAGANIHIELNKIDFFQHVFEKKVNIGLISCREELPNLLEQNFGLQDIVFYKIPAEFKYGKQEVTEKHYPDVFNHVIRRIEKEAKGKVYLVAAGLLGKIYCAKIKEAGGIGLDIGSIADAWVGVKSRPYISTDYQIGKVEK